MFICFGLHSQEILQQLQQIQQLERKGNLQEAKIFYENIYSQNSDNILIFTRYKDFCMRTRDYQRTLELIDTRSQNHPNDFKLKIWKAQIVYKLGNQEEALETWKKIIDNNASNLSAYLHVANVLTTENLLDEAVDIYSSARKMKNRKDLFSLNLANIHIARMDYKNATDELLIFLKTNPKQYALVEKQFFQFVNSDKTIKTVVPQIKKAIAAEPSNKTLKTLLINIYLRTGDYAEGFKIAVEAEKQLKNSRRGEALFYFGNKAFEAGASEMAEKVFLELLKTCPDFKRREFVSFNLAQCYEALEKYDRAINEYRNVADITNNKTLRTQALFSVGLIIKDKQYQFDKALELFQKIEDKQPPVRDRSNIQFEIGKCYIALGKLKNAEPIFREILKSKFDTKLKSDQRIKARIFLADVLYLQGKYKEALELLDELKGINLDVRSAQSPVLNDGLELKLFIKQHLTKSAEPLHVFTRAELLKRQRCFDEAITVLDSLIIRWPDDPVTIYGIFDQGKIEFQSGNYKNSLENFDLLNTRFASHVLADHALSYAGLACEKMGKKKEALKRYDKLLLEYPHSLQADEIRQRIQNIEKE